MLTRAGFELSRSRYRSAALPVELSSPQGLETSFTQLRRTRYSHDNLTLIHERMCSVSIYFRIIVKDTWAEVFHNNLTLPKSSEKCWLERDSSQHFLVDFGSVSLSWKISVHTHVSFGNIQQHTKLRSFDSRWVTFSYHFRTVKLYSFFNSQDACSAF